MSTINQRAENTIIAALLAGFWAGVLMEKLDTLTLRFNLPFLHVVAQWWPVLLIASGLVLLVRHQFSSQQPVREWGKPETVRLKHAEVRNGVQVHAK